MVAYVPAATSPESLLDSLGLKSVGAGPRPSTATGAGACGRQIGFVARLFVVINGARERKSE